MQWQRPQSVGLLLRVDSVVCVCAKSDLRLAFITGIFRRVLLVSCGSIVIVTYGRTMNTVSEQRSSECVCLRFAIVISHAQQQVWHFCCRRRNLRSGRMSTRRSSVKCVDVQTNAHVTLRRDLLIWSARDSRVTFLPAGWRREIRVNR